MKSNKGFTLVEMLVVVAIIGILASVFLIGLRGFRGSAYDARRLSDLQKVQGYLELYYNKNRVYPNVSTWAELEDALIDPSDGAGVRSIPNDPLYSDDIAGSSYKYGVDDSDRQSYVLGATLSNENVGALKESSDLDELTFGVVCDGAVYCIQF
jgi:prepilin-type N-terminal cleavage/methylation domain-containing protein